MRRKGITICAALAALAVAVPAFATSTATTAVVTAGKPSEFRFTLSKKTLPKGTVTFTVVNKGKLAHDFKIAGKKSKLLAPGKTTRFTVTLKRGKAAYLCTVAGHAAGGMKGTLTVK